MRRPSAFITATVLWLAVLSSAVEVIYLKHRARGLFIELQTLLAERDRLNLEWSRLQVHVTTWSSPARIEAEAQYKLKLKVPAPAEIRVLPP